MTAATASATSAWPTPSYPLTVDIDDKINIQVSSCVVTSQNKFSETQFRSSTTTTGGFSSYSPPRHNTTVTSKSITIHEFWVREDNGNEYDVKLRGIDISVGNGQRIKLLSGTSRKKGKSHYTHMINQSAGNRLSKILSDKEILVTFGYIVSDKLYYVLLVVAAILLGIISGGFPLPILAFIGGIAYRIYTIGTLKKTVIARINELVQKESAN